MTVSALAFIKQIEHSVM